MANYDSIDLDWTWDGDYILGADGDLKDTEDDTLRSLINEMHTIARSEFNDWQEHPNLGANMSEFVGEPNTRQIGEAIRGRFHSRLIASGIIKSEDLTVRVTPVGRHQAIIIISVQATATSGNNIRSAEPVVVTFLYDSLEDSVFFVEESKTSRDFRGT